MIEVVDEKGHVSSRWNGIAKMDGGPACLSADGSRLAVAWSAWPTPSEWIITVYGPNTGSEPAFRLRPEAYTWYLAFSPDGFAPRRGRRGRHHPHLE